MEKCNVTILPEKITVSVLKGTSLLLAARKAGIDIESPCGGNGTCGKCAVKLISGEAKILDDAHLSQDLKNLGFVLACRTRVIEDIVIDVPFSSRLTKHKVVLSNKRTRFNKDNDYFAKTPMNPLCKKLYVSMGLPDLSNNLSDMERLKTQVLKQYGINNIKASLSCLRSLPKVLRDGNFSITITVFEEAGVFEIIDLEAGESKEPTYGIAVDIGTTTIVVNLLELSTGKIIDKAGTYNKQSIYGSDVISRIIFSEENENGLELLHKSIINDLNELINEVIKKAKISKSKISAMVCAGNTVMSHFFLKLPAENLRLEPYIPAMTKPPIVRASELGIIINPSAPIVTLPSVSSYVGGDITAGVLATMINSSDKLTLFIDIGTNGELVLGNNEWMVTCSCSAGPAFEGSGISCGMRAMDGAIDFIEIDRFTLETSVRTIGNQKPVGICGSGLIYSLSEMMEVGIIDRAGKIIEKKNQKRIRYGADGLEFIVVSKDKTANNQDIVITEGDIKNLLRAKGAIFAGIISK